MKYVRRQLSIFACILISLLGCIPFSNAADHNDPNAINSIFAGTELSAADLYDLFGWPSKDSSGVETAVLALTFGPAPEAGTLDPDLLYRIRISPSPRNTPNIDSDASLNVMLRYFESVKDKYAALHPSEIRVTVDKEKRATITFSGFPGGDFSKVIDSNKSESLTAPNGCIIKAYIGGRDDAFFNDLPGFFRSINYAPQFYKVAQTDLAARELKIPKTLLELEGNTLFNFDPAHPNYGYDPLTKRDLPSGDLKWTGNKFLKDAAGNFRFVYSGTDAQAGKNINAIIVEIPLSYLTKTPEADRVVNAWGESWVLKAASKAEAIPDDRAPLPGPFWFRHPYFIPSLILLFGAVLLFFACRTWWRRAVHLNGPRHSALWPAITAAAGLLVVLLGTYAAFTLAGIANQKPALTLTPKQLDEQLQNYKLVDTDGQAFADAALNGRADDRQLGGTNFWLAPNFVLRLAHLGWGFGPSISALGLKSSFDHGNAPVSVYKVYKETEILDAFLRSRKVVFQRLNMPDDSWNPKHLDIPLRRAFEVFIPNVCAIDMDTTGTWPYGRRLEDQVATRFLSLFLDMSSELNGSEPNIETLSDQALWNKAKILPKTPPNPLKNDKPFLNDFPYLADPWPQGYEAPSPVLK